MAGLRERLTPGTGQSMKKLASVSIVLNVVFVMVLVPLTVVLHREIQSLAVPCADDVLSHRSNDGVIDPSDVTISDVGEFSVDDVNSYCFKESAIACEERGGRVKRAEEGGHSLCCGHLGGHLFGVMSETLGQKLRVDSYRGQLLHKIKHYMAQLHMDSQTSTFRPAAHVGILQNGDIVEPGSQVPRLHWNGTGEGTFLSGGIIHKGDRLAVTRPGYYYVYSGLQFDVDPTSEQSGAIVAFLFRTVNGTSESSTKLMTSRESSCRHDDVTGPVSMHMAGIFLLRRDDEISVISFSHALLNTAPSATYLGLHMV